MTAPLQLGQAEFNALTLAVGKVTIWSATIDGCLRDIIQDLMGLSDSGWILIEGQSTEFLHNTLPVILDMEDSHRTTWTAEQHAALVSASRGAKSLQPYRNTIVHGTWLKPPSKKPLDYEETILPRPWGDPDDGTEWLCFRSRHREYARMQRWTVADVELLAKKMQEAHFKLAVTFAKMEHVRNPNYIEDTQWARYLVQDPPK